MALMKFYTGSEANAQSHLDGIYLATDTHKLFYKGSPYGGDSYVELDWVQDFKEGSGTMEEAAFEKLKDAVDNYKLLVVNCTGAAHSTRVCTPEIGDDGSYICKFTDINNYENAEEYILAVKIASVNPSTRAITMLHDTTYPLGGKDIDLSNYYTIAQVDEKIGTNVYTGANYISKETNLTEAVLQLDEEIKATNDNLALEHTNAEATYAKKTDISGYLPLSGGTMTGGINFEGGGELNTEDLPDGLSIVDEQGNIYPNGEGWTQDKGYTGIGISKDGHKFVMAIADNIQDKYADDLSINTTKAWSNALYSFDVPDLPNISIEQAVQDFDSKSNTDAILAALATSWASNETNNAAVVCRNYSKGVIGKGQWDLPASGILDIISSFGSRIISLGNQIFGNGSWGDLFNVASVWSSNEYNTKRSPRVDIWSLGFVNSDKTNTHHVVPVFTGIATKLIITVQGKSDTDVLNANGGTVSIQDIISQVTVPTKVSELTNDSGYQTESQVAAKVSALVDSAPETLNTLNELAAALGDDPNFATTVSTKLGKKLDISTYTSDKATFALKSEIPNVSNFLTISNAQSTYLTKTDASNTYQPKGSYLTSVSIATISDLNANWDALLKSNPSGYVTRWPNISEVGSKQNLVIKLNGGTTEGTNQFTYNVTAAKSINITPSSIGAAASSHTHNASQVSGLSKVATSGSYNDLTNKPTIPSAYTLPKATTSTLGGIKVGDGLEITADGTLNCIIDPGSGSVSWENISGKPSVFATNIASINDLNSGWDALLKAAPNIPSLNGYATQEWVNGRGFLTSIPSEYVTDTELNAKGFLTKATADGYYQPKGNYLTSVSWSQISGKPTIPSVSAVNNSGTVVLKIDSNTITFQSDKILFNGSSIMVIEAITAGDIDNIF